MRGQSMGSSLIVAFKSRVNGLDSFLFLATDVCGKRSLRSNKVRVSVSMVGAEVPRSCSQFEMKAPWQRRSI